jgi:peroxiredoxin Q/BCP
MIRMKKPWFLGICLVAATLAVGAVPGFAQETAKPVTEAQPADPDAALNAMVGKDAPKFSLPDQNDKPVTLADSKGKWVVLAFYPKDMTTGCTFQNRSYSQNIEKFAPLNAVVYTISTQNTASKRDFCSKENLKHTLLSDVDGKVATAYNVATTYGVLHETIARRITFYINPEGKIAAVDTKIHVQKAAEDSLATLQKLAASTKTSEKQSGR